MSTASSTTWPAEDRIDRVRTSSEQWHASPIDLHADLLNRGIGMPRPARAAMKARTCCNRGSIANGPARSRCSTEPCRTWKRSATIRPATNALAISKPTHLLCRALDINYSIKDPSQVAHEHAGECRIFHRLHRVGGVSDRKRSTTWSRWSLRTTKAGAGMLCVVARSADGAAEQRSAWEVRRPSFNSMTNALRKSAAE